MPQTALLLGATGQVGQHVLKELLTSPEWSKVGEFGRRVADPSSLPNEGRDKIVQKVIDFEKLDEAGLANDKWDVVFITLGTTKKAAGSTEAFEKIDREYVINAARAAKTEGPQRLVYVSSIGANSSSPFLYAKSKGLTEEGLAALGYNDTIVFRPAILAGATRPDSRPMESVAGALLGLVSHLSDNAQIHIGTLAKALVGAGKLGTAALPASARAERVGKEGGLFTLIGNAGALHFFK